MSDDYRREDHQERAWANQASQNTGECFTGLQGNGKKLGFCVILNASSVAMNSNSPPVNIWNHLRWKNVVYLS